MINATITAILEEFSFLFSIMSPTFDQDVFESSNSIRNPDSSGYSRNIRIFDIRSMIMMAVSITKPVHIFFHTGAICKKQ